MHVLIPPAINIPKQNLRNGTLHWLSRTHSQTHLSGNHSSSNRAENCRKLHSKTNWAVTNACKALEIPIPVTRPQSIKCQGPAATERSPGCVLPLSQVGAMHVALVLPPSQQQELPPDRIILCTWMLPAGMWFPQRVPWSNGVPAGFLSVCCKNIAHCDSEVFAYIHQGFPVLCSLLVSPLRRDGRLKVTLNFLLCNY